MHDSGIIIIIAIIIVGFLQALIEGKMKNGTKGICVFNGGGEGYVPKEREELMGWEYQ